ncbi:hypothetical protein Taro_012561 [Colocasia esculenta]|uniref:Uncharacterized protein n=1 Tax=Colocasia esculenta TaxID=4460 RepID=A0A843U499_COLES|nr:hypothetical protein [Colocasia esculenta]
MSPAEHLRPFDPPLGFPPPPCKKWPPPPSLTPYTSTTSPFPPSRPETSRLAAAMAASWATSASSLTDQDDPFLHSPSFVDDDPSSYLLYPPGFGPVEDCLPLPPSPGHDPPLLLPGETGATGLPDNPYGFGLKGGDLELDGNTWAEMELGEGSGESQAGGLPPDALSDRFCFVGTWDWDDVPMFSRSPHCGSGDGFSPVKRGFDAGVLTPYDVDARSSGCSVAGMGKELAAVREEDVTGTTESPVLTTQSKAEADDVAETSSRGDRFSKCDERGSSSSGFSSSPPPILAPSIGEQNSGGGRDFQGDDDNKEEGDDGKGKKMDEVSDFEEGEIRTRDHEVVVDGSTDRDVVSAVEEPSWSLDELQIIGNRVIVEGIQKPSPLISKGSLLWITKTSAPLGPIDEVVGAGRNPCFVVSYKSVEEVPAGISEGASVSFVIFDDPRLHKEALSDEMKFPGVQKEAELIRPPPHQANGGRETGRLRNEESLESRSLLSEYKGKAQFNMVSGGLQRDTQRLAPCASSTVPPVEHPPHLPTHPQAMPQPPYVPKSMQAPPWVSHIPGRLKQPPCQPCVRDQLQAGAPSPLHCWNPTKYYQAPPFLGTSSGGSLPAGLLGSGQVCPGGPHIVHSVPHGGQPDGPIGVLELQNLLSNAAWASHRSSHQQFDNDLPIMLPGNGMPCHHPQDVHAFHDRHHNQTFPHFATTDGITFEHHCCHSLGMPTDTSCRQGGLSHHPAYDSLRCLGSTGHGVFFQAPPGHTSAYKRVVLGAPSGNQNLTEVEPAYGQGWRWDFLVVLSKNSIQSHGQPDSTLGNPSGDDWQPGIEVIVCSKMKTRD